MSKNNKQFKCKQYAKYRRMWKRNNRGKRNRWTKQKINVKLTHWNASVWNTTLYENRLNAPVKRQSFRLIFFKEKARHCCRLLIFFNGEKSKDTDGKALRRKEGSYWASQVGSKGKESPCNAGDTGWIPGSGRSPGEGNCNPLQYFCLGESHGQRSLAGYSPWNVKVSQLYPTLCDPMNYIVPPWTIQGILQARILEWVAFPSIFSEMKAMAPHSSTLAWKIPWMGLTPVHGVATSVTWLSDFTFTFHFHALEKEMATHSSVLVWRIPGTAEPGGLPSKGSHRVGHDWSDLAVALAAASSRYQGFPVGSDGQKSTCHCRKPGFNPWVGKIPLEKGMATHSSILA